MLEMIPLAIFDASEFFQWFVDHASYLFVFVFMVIESSFIPFPSEVIVPPAAYLACTNTGAGSDMNIFLVVVFATLGALVGAFINYYLALWIGRPVVYRFADSRLGHACLIDRAKVEKAEKYFDRHGARMNVAQFAIFTSLGALVWNAILAFLGYWLSLHVTPDMLFDKVEEYNRYLTWAGYALFLLCILYILYNAFRRKK